MTVIDLSDRSTTSKKIPEIDSLYVYHTRHKVKFTHHYQQGTGYKYTNHNALERAGGDEIHIYHRTAEIRGVMKGLTIVTKHSKFREVQKWFNEQIKAIETDDKLFNKFSHAKATPAEIGLRYMY